jgi:hypothetical protein
MVRRNRIARPPRWLRWASGLLLIAAGCAQPLVTAAAAPQIPAGAARIWFYKGYEPPGYLAQATLIPTIVANGAYVGQAPPGTVFYRDVPPGHYDITIPDSFGFNGSAHFDLAAGQQAFVKIVFWKTGHDSPRAQTQGFSARLVSRQTAVAEIPSLAAKGEQR